MSFPYQERFTNYLASELFLADSTINDLVNDVERFFKYLRQENSNYINNPSVLNLSELDVKEYLGFLQIQKNIKNSTYNKILTHLNKYFIFLFQNQLITSLPTLSLKGLTKNNSSQKLTDWTQNIELYLKDFQLSFYTRLTLLLLSHYYTITEIIEPSFYKVLTVENWNPTEKDFLNQFNHFHQKYEQLQQSKSLFLKEKINLAQPALSLAGLHKVLKKDQGKIDIELKPSKLYQSAVLDFINKNQTLTDDELCQHLRLTIESLAYYRTLNSQK